jgi:hypothetical protein
MGAPATEAASRSAPAGLGPSSVAAARPAPPAAASGGNGSWNHSIAGGLAGSAAVLFLHPFDVIKTRLQGSQPGTRHYMASAHCSNWAVANRPQLCAAHRLVPEVPQASHLCRAQYRPTPQCKTVPPRQSCSIATPLTPLGG